ncbi:reprolysin-like metallopeptidase [Pleionea mediterranea]|uniref:Reprolysin-like metallo-peptidase family M12B n=1 Tax=Pleionea mediterranea TaxID=523701 RepID=A0A316G1S8_9GAMM|nr:tandem-95 repeat protein [Pleionea mediterranea]PWK54345.1 reprolysin-like metallo-peptidase family M12B [Pleionea mediterranea]
MNTQSGLNKVVTLTSAITICLASQITQATTSTSEQITEATHSTFKDKSYWNIISKMNDSQYSSQAENYPYTLMNVDETKLTKILTSTPSYITKNQHDKSITGIKLQLPLPNGESVEYIVYESAVLPTSLSQKYPSIKTFSGFNLKAPDNTGKFDITPQGFHAMFRHNGTMYIIDPEKNTNQHYRIYNASEALNSQSYRPLDRVLESSEKEGSENESFHNKTKTLKAEFGEELRTYRLAVSAAAEFTQFHGGTVESGLAAVVTTINRVNEIYEKDLAIFLMLSENNDQVIFTDTASDPFNNNTSDINLNRDVLDTNIGSSNYDIGHVVNTGGGGLAGLGVVCGNRRASGVTGLSNPTTDIFYIDYVAHEIGHQFGANHTFNGGAGSCGSNRSSGAAYEPGSASTIMGYAGICGDQNLQNSSDAFFHSHSIEEIRNYISNSNGASCGTNSSLSNNVPTVNAGADITIPASTPFSLTAEAIDTDGNNSLTYSWEQLDLGPQTFSRSEMIDDGERPLFRSYTPSSNATRYFPQLSRVLNDTSSFDEVLPTTDRNMDFRITVRDGAGGVNMDTVSISVDDTAGPFTVQPLSDNGPFEGFTTIELNWNVANTNNDITNCNAVKVVLSDDGGNSFDNVLLETTDNDGTENVQLPNADINDARILVACTDDRFFNVSPTSFSVSALAGVPVITGQSDLTVLEDNSLTLSLSDITVTDVDNNFPDDFSLSLENGDNYTFENFTVSPSADFNGTLSVNITVFDGQYTSPVYPLEIDVEAVNDAPQISASNQELITDEDVSLDISLSAVSINDIDSQQFTLNIISGENYSVENTTITPSENFEGDISIQVSVSDGELDSNVITLPVSVTPVNDAPIASDDNFSVEQDSQQNSFNLLNNDSDVDIASVLSITNVNYSGSGTLQLSDDNLSVTYTPGSGFVGNETFSYTITDEAGASASANVQITVTEKPEEGGGGTINLWTLLCLMLVGARVVYSRNK